MEVDKDLEQQYRKNLMIVAGVVFIYSIAGGRMGNDLSLFGAKLIFSHPVWLEYAMVMMMCFFWWRQKYMAILLYLNGFIGSSCVMEKKNLR